MFFFSVLFGGWFSDAREVVEWIGSEGFGRRTLLGAGGGGLGLLVEVGWIGLGWIGLDWTGLDWIGLDWTGLDWIGLDWTGSDWIELDWIGLDLGAYCYGSRVAIRM